MQDLRSPPKLENFGYDEDDDDAETNTVIENECDNDYMDIYQSIGDDDQQTEELRKKREFEYEKLLLKKEIMSITVAKK